MASWCKNMCCLKGEDDDSEESEPDLISFHLLTDEEEDTIPFPDNARERDLIRACEEPLPNAPHELRSTSNESQVLDLSTVGGSSSEREVDFNQSQNLENAAVNTQSPNSAILGGERNRGPNVNSTLRWYGIPERNTRRNGEQYELPDDFWSYMEFRLSMMMREEQGEDVL